MGLTKREFLGFGGAAILAACKRGGSTGITWPRYPGAEYTPMERREFGSYELFGAMLRTPADVPEIAKWYSGQLQGWEKSGDVMEVSYRLNMEYDESGKTARPVDPSKKGGLIEISIGGVITMWESVPKAKK